MAPEPVTQLTHPATAPPEAAKKRTRPKTLTIILAAVIALLLGAGAAFGLNAVTAKSVSAEFGKLVLVGDSIAIAPGQSVDVKLLSEPKTLFMDTLSLTSSRPSVLEVADKNGKTTIKGVKTGEANLTVSSSQRNASKTYRFIVSDPPEAIAGLPEELILDIDEVFALEPILEPADSAYPIGFESSDEAIVSVNDDGELTGHAKGTATITVSSGDITQEVAIDVHRLVQAVSLPDASVELLPGQTYQIEAAVEPGDAQDKTVSYQTDDPTSAMVSESGLVTAVWDDLSSYYTYITVTSADGPEAVLTVEVNNPYRVEPGDGPEDIPATSYEVTPMIFDTAVPNCTGLTVEYGVTEASSSGYLSELRNGSFDVWVIGTSGSWTKVGSFSMGGKEEQTADITFEARTIARVGVVPSSATGSGTSWRSSLGITAIVFAGQPALPGDT
ncbi:MAG: Ig-like domain-containing protein [Bifidobacteriaceae bacterium]|jgi:hypothetical protein|nr:Ig-like domain-containing protein [Bifidobacteriaceae bacterium]